MLKYLSLFLVATSACLAAQRAGEVEVERHSPTLPSHPRQVETFHHTPPMNERKITELTPLEDKATTIAKQKHISDEVIEQALSERRIILQTQKELLNVEFRITTLGGLIFLNAN
jgi:hypothetical protein